MGRAQGGQLRAASVGGASDFGVLCQRTGRGASQPEGTQEGPEPVQSQLTPRPTSAQVTRPLLAGWASDPAHQAHSVLGTGGRPQRRPLLLGPGADPRPAPACGLRGWPLGRGFPAVTSAGGPGPAPTRSSRACLPGSRGQGGQLCNPSSGLCQGCLEVMCRRLGRPVRGPAEGERPAENPRPAFGLGPHPASPRSPAHTSQPRPGPGMDGGRRQSLGPAVQASTASPGPPTCPLRLSSFCSFR